ncbi:response regulator [Clostridium sp. DL1XJH146]
MNAKIAVLIADDDSLIRDSLKIILNLDNEIDVVQTAVNGREAADVCRKYKIDVALLDVRMPIMNGVQAIKEITKNTKTKTLILTTFDEDAYINEALQNGAKGYLLKNNSPEIIINAIKAVNGGNIVLQDIIMDKFKKGLNTNNFVENYDFSSREKEIIKEVSEGLSNKEIAGKLFISQGTVKNYISGILSKTGLKHRTQIAIYYLTK